MAVNDMSATKTCQLKPVQFPYDEFVKLAERVAEVRYPAIHGWDEETIKRHKSHLVIAYQLRPELLVEDTLALIMNAQCGGFFP